jgi:hypothetical protein
MPVSGGSHRKLASVMVMFRVMGGGSLEIVTLGGVWPSSGLLYAAGNVALAGTPRGPPGQAPGRDGPGRRALLGRSQRTSAGGFVAWGAWAGVPRDAARDGLPARTAADGDAGNGAAGSGRPGAGRDAAPWRHRSCTPDAVPSGA